MNNDLKIIKKKYGEKMMHFCRDLFPTILEIEGLLPKLLMDNFNENHYLYDDIVKNEMQFEFKNFIFNLVIKDDKREIHINRTPEELMDDAGYIILIMKVYVHLEIWNYMVLVDFIQIECFLQLEKMLIK